MGCESEALAAGVSFGQTATLALSRPQGKTSHANVTAFCVEFDVGADLCHMHPPWISACLITVRTWGGSGFDCFCGFRCPRLNARDRWVDRCVPRLAVDAIWAGKRYLGGSIIPKSPPQSSQATMPSEINKGAAPGQALRAPKARLQRSSRSAHKRSTGSSLRGLASFLTPVYGTHIRCAGVSIGRQAR
jgi:hypothetical protein